MQSRDRHTYHHCHSPEGLSSDEKMWLQAASRRTAADLNTTDDSQDLDVDNWLGTAAPSPPPSQSQPAAIIAHNSSAAPPGLSRPLGLDPSAKPFSPTAAALSLSPSLAPASALHADEPRPAVSVITITREPKREGPTRAQKLDPAVWGLDRPASSKGRRGDGNRTRLTSAAAPRGPGIDAPGASGAAVTEGGGRTAKRKNKTKAEVGEPATEPAVAAVIVERPTPTPKVPKPLAAPSDAPGLAAPPPAAIASVVPVPRSAPPPATQAPAPSRNWADEVDEEEAAGTLPSARESSAGRGRLAAPRAPGPTAPPPLVKVLPKPPPDPAAFVERDEATAARDARDAASRRLDASEHDVLAGEALDACRHVLEIFGFGAETSHLELDLLAGALHNYLKGKLGPEALQPVLKWVDDNHCLCVFQSKEVRRRAGQRKLSSSKICIRTEFKYAYFTGSRAMLDFV